VRVLDPGRPDIAECAGEEPLNSDSCPEPEGSTGTNTPEPPELPSTQPSQEGFNSIQLSSSPGDQTIDPINELLLDQSNMCSKPGQIQEFDSLAVNSDLS
jgi:hypothetical protein